MKSKHCKNRLVVLPLAALIVTFTSCEDLVVVDPPITGLNQENVYTDDQSAAAVLTGIYADQMNLNVDLGGTSITSMSLYPGLSADELTPLSLTVQRFPVFYTNDLSTSTTNGRYWNICYFMIFNLNSAIEGLGVATKLTPAVKQQLLGEAKFMRAFNYFYLVNVYGEVPLVLSTDYKVTQTLARAPAAQVYQQIVADLTDAQNLLSAAYLTADVKSSTTERVRPTRWAAAALLARVYLYSANYGGSEAQASTVINNSLYSLSTLNNAFLKNSAEAIWQLQPVRTGTQANTGEGALFVLPATGPNINTNPIYLSNSVVSSFDSTDQRRANWVNSVTVSGTTYYYAYKYKVGRVAAPVSEYSMVLRLGEQYLVRAEARAQMGNLSGAASDLNAIRTRAGLPNTTAATQPDLLTAIMQERRFELFTEWGHRWFDLKRTNTIDAVMNVVAPQKSGTWAPYKALYPIPQTEIILNPNLVQNPGY